MSAQRWAAAALATLMTGATMSIAIARLVHTNEQDRVESTFALESQRVLSSLEGAIGEQIEEFETAAAFLGTAWPLGPEGFNRVIDPDGDGRSGGALDTVVVLEMIPRADFADFLRRERELNGIDRIDPLAPVPEDASDRAVVTRVFAFEGAPSTSSGVGPGLDITALMSSPLAAQLRGSGEVTLLPLSIIGFDNIETELRDLRVQGIDYTFVTDLVGLSGEQHGLVVATGRMTELLSVVAVEFGGTIGVRIDSLSGELADIELGSFNLDRAGAAGDARYEAVREIVTGDLVFRVTAWSDETASMASVLAVLVTGVAASVLAAIALSVKLRSGERERRAQTRLEDTQRRVETDTLTGLLNREGLTRALDERRTSDHGTPLAVLFCDLDRFKRVNDTLGHEAGDDLLVEIARRLRQVIRGEDAAGRFGGDEFIVMGWVTDETAGQDLAERVRRALAFEMSFDGFPVEARASVGLTILHPDDDRTVEELLRDADTAMYQAKAEHQGAVVVFDDKMRTAVVEQVQLEGELRSALSRQQFEVHYQPLFHRDGDVAGLEALVRWRHPDRGLLGPAAFTDVARENGMWSTISTWVLDRAIADLATHEHAVPLLAVNVAAEQLYDDALPNLVAELLAEHELAPDRLVLEISEEAVLDDADERTGLLRRLHDQGVALALDDFGTGRSSFDLLRRLSFVDIVKLDRSFILDIANDATVQAVVRGVLATAHALGCTTVAEGIETERQRDRCVKLGIEVLQGYWLGRPARLPDLACLQGGPALTGSR